MLSAFSPRSSADWPIMVTPPRFLRTVLMEASAPSSNCLILHRREDLFDEDVLGNAEIGGVVEHIVDAPEQPHHQRLDQVGVLLVVHALEVEALEARQREAVFHVVEDGVVDALANPLRQIAVELLGQEEIGQPAVLRVEQVHILHGLVDHIVVFRLQLRAAVGQQELDEASTGT